MKLLRNSLLATALGVLSLSTAQAQKITEKVIYTLKAGELIRPVNEHSVSLTAEEAGWMIFTERSKGVSREYYTIVNGKEYGPFKTEMIDWWQHSYFPEKGVFGSMIRKGNDNYLSFAGKEYGPCAPMYYTADLIDGKAIVSYNDPNNTIHVWYNGKEIANLAASEDGTTYPPYPMTDAKGNYMFSYHTPAGDIININGKTYGPYETGYTSAINNGHYAFTYGKGYNTDSPSYYYNIDGKDYGPYATTGAIQISDDGKIIYDYTDLNQKYHLFVNGKEIASGDYGYWSLNNKKGTYLYAVTKNNDENPETTLVVNGKTIGTYKAVNGAFYSENGEHYTYTAVEGEESNVYIDGKLVASLNMDNSYASPQFSENAKHYLINSYDAESNKTSVIVDGKPKGEYSNLNNAMIGNDGDLMIQYSDDSGQMFLELNGKLVDIVKVDVNNGGYPYIMSDDKYKHILSYDYSNPENVMVDGKLLEGKGGVTYFYNKFRNSFQWIGVDGINIVLREVKF